MRSRLDRLSPLVLALCCGTAGLAASACAQSPPEGAGRAVGETFPFPFRPLWLPDRPREEAGRCGPGLLAGFPSTYSLGQTDKGPQDSLKVTAVVNDRTGRSGPALLGAWRNEEALGLPFAGSVALFRELKGGDGFAASPDSKIVGGSGLSCKLPIHPGAALVVSAGPAMTYLGLPGTSRAPDRTGLPLQSRLLRLEAQCRWPLMGPVGLECQGTACPALSAGERDRLNQDLRVVCPLGHGGQLRIGAKRSWEVGGDPRPGTDAMQFYGGFRLRW
jgi:hypothetical protein